MRVMAFILATYCNFAFLKSIRNKILGKALLNAMEKGNDDRKKKSKIDFFFNSLNRASWKCLQILFTSLHWPVERARASRAPSCTIFRDCTTPHLAPVGVEGLVFLCISSLLQSFYGNELSNKRKLKE